MGIRRWGVEQSSLRKRWSAWREWLLKPPPETSPIDPAELRAKLGQHQAAKKTAELMVGYLRAGTH